MNMITGRGDKDEQHISLCDCLCETNTMKGEGKCENHFHLLCAQNAIFLLFTHSYNGEKNLVELVLEQKKFWSTFRGCFEGFPVWFKLVEDTKVKFFSF